MMDVVALEREVLSLDFRGRGRLASLLLRSLDDDEKDASLSEEEIEKLWLDECERRDFEMDEDPSVIIPGDEVLREMRELLK